MGRIVFLDPRVEVAPGVGQTARRLGELRGQVVGIIDNGHVNGTQLLHEIERLLTTRCDVEVVFRTKSALSNGAPAELLDEFASRCGAVITGVGN